MKRNTRKFRLALTALTVVALLVAVFGAVSVWAQSNEVWVDDDAAQAWYDDATHLGTIQEGIDAIADGGTVYVAAGTYNEVVRINKPLHLLGAQAGVDARTRTGLESVIDPNDPGGGQPKSWVVRVQSSNITVDGFTVQNPTLVYGSAGLFCVEPPAGTLYENLIFRNNILQNPGIKTSPSTSYGKFGYDIGNCDNVLIEYNYIRDILCDTATPWNGTAAIWPWGTTGLKIRYNKIEHVTTFGVGLSGSNSNVLILENEVSLGDPGEEAVPSVRTAGIRVGPSQNDDVHIEGNSIYNCPGTAAQPGVGIRIQTWPYIEFSTGITRGSFIYAIDNVVTGCPIGVRTTAGAAGSRIEIEGNTFEDNEVQVSDGAEALIIEDVLTSNTFDRAVVVDHPGDSLLHTIWSSIQDSIGNASSGDTVIVAAGTYDEYVTIDKSLTLKGDPGGDRPKIVFSNTDEDGITVAGDNVTLDNLWLYREGHSYYRAIIAVPKGCCYPDYTIGTRGLMVQNCLIEGGRYGMYVSVEDMTVQNCTFKEPYRDGIVTAGIAGTTTITRNHFIGIGDTKQAIYMTTGPGKPYDSGTLNISYNTHTGGGHFFLVDYWGWDEGAPVDLQIIHNSIDQIGNRKGVVFYAAYAQNPQGFPKFNSVTIQDNIFSNCGPAVYVDYQDWGGAPPADSRTIPSSGQIVVDNNLTHNVTAGANDTMDAAGTYGYYNVDGMTPSGASLAMFDLRGNITGDPRYVDAAHGGICFEYWALQYGSPAIGTASDSTNIGAWQGTPSTTTMTSFVVDDVKFDCKKEDNDGKVHVKGELELDTDKDISEGVVVTVGPWSCTINMEEKGKDGEHWEYKRPKDGEDIIKHMKIDWNKGTFDFEMDGLDLTGVERPVTISVQIGDDFGQATVLTSRITEVTIDSGKKDDDAKVRVKGELGFGPICGPYGSPTSSIIVSVTQEDTNTDLSWSINQEDIEVKGKEDESWEYKPEKHTDTVFKHSKVDWNKGTFDFDFDGVALGSLDLSNEVEVSVTIEGNTISETVLLTEKGKKDQWKPEAIADQLQVVAYPNPIRDVHTATFQVMGTLAAQVEEIRVQIYDLSGRLVWEDAALGSELDWHTDSLSGEYLANGIYLYRVQVRIGGSWINQDIGKIAVLR